MKTSNKLLLGLFIFVVLIMIVATITMKNRAGIQSSSIPQERVYTHSDTLTISTDSTNLCIKISNE